MHTFLEETYKRADQDIAAGTFPSRASVCFNINNFRQYNNIHGLTGGNAYKGGEIVPTFFIGSTFGYFFGSLIGFSPYLCAAVAMGAVFCGATNAPVTSIFVCIELFGTAGLPYYLLAVAIAYIASSYYGLYPAQKIVFSKYQAKKMHKEE